MWPILLDMTEEESIQSLRHLELEAYSSLVSALRAQGNLNQEKRKLLKETSIALNISNERHKVEVRRAISDERLNTIAYHITGQLTSLEDWALEGRRLIPLLPRMPPQTPYSIIADDASEAAAQYNKQLPLPANTERKRPMVTQLPSASNNETGGKSQTFRVPEVPKDDFKKRKVHIGESSTLAQHLLGPKLSRIQQIYRQTSKGFIQKHKDAYEVENQEAIKQTMTSSSIKIQSNPVPSNNIPQKINVIQNISIPAPSQDPVLEDKLNRDLTHECPMVNENQAPSGKSINVKYNNIGVVRPTSGSSNDNVEYPVDPVVKINAPKTINKGQKLIVVTGAQTITTNSSLQKTLSVPINKLTKLNLDKFKIVGSNQFPTTLQVSNVANTQNISPKLVTLKSTSNKKVIPLSQLQMLNSKGLKVIPFSGKVYDKHINFSSVQQDVPVKKAIITINSHPSGELTLPTTVRTETVPIERIEIEDTNTHMNETSSDLQSEELEDCNNTNMMEFDNDSNSDGSEVTDTDEECNIVNEMDIDSYSVMESNEKGDLLEECEIFQDGGELF